MPGLGNLVYSNIPENDYPEYNASLTYSVNAYVISTTDHKIYQSLTSNNRGNPLTDETNWLEVGYTNRWRLHDDSLQSRTESPNGEIHNQYEVTGICTSVAALNLVATEVQVRMYDYIEGLVYDRTISLIDSASVTNWYDYFFSTVPDFVPDAFFTDLPSYANTLLDVVIRSGSSGSACGALIIGELIDVGYTQYGAKVGIQDYSIKDQDQFGNYRITERPYRKTGDFQLMVENSFVDQLQNLLARYRAQPVLYIGSEQFSSMAIYGFYRSFDITVSYPQHSLCSINLEGLT